MAAETPRVFICFASPKRHLDQLKAAAKKAGRFDWWNIHKSAQSGDRVVFYMIRPVSAFIAQGFVDGSGFILDLKESQWDGKHVAWIKDVSMLERYIPLNEAKQQFPDWKYLIQPRQSTLVPEEVADRFLQLIGADNSEARLHDQQFQGGLPGEISDDVPLFEGCVRQVTVNAYERNPEARMKCIEHYGATCVVCNFNFAAVYGQVAAGFIHVHHVKSLADIGAEYEVDPIADLSPVCPNCHAVIHLNGKTRTIAELKKLLKHPT